MSFWVLQEVYSHVTPRWDCELTWGTPGDQFQGLMMSFGCGERVCSQGNSRWDCESYMGHPLG